MKYCPPSHLIQPRCSILCSLDKFQYLTENEKNKKKTKEKRRNEKKKHSIGAHMSTISLVVNRNSRDGEWKRVHQQKDDQFNQYKEQVSEKKITKSTRTHTCRSGSTYRSFTRTILFQSNWIKCNSHQIWNDRSSTGSSLS